MGARLASEHPKINDKLKATVLAAPAVRFHPLVDGVLAPAAGVLMGAVGLVLLVACANVANMLLARAAARRREIAVRLAIGANRGRVVRQLLAESAVLAALGGGAGMLLAYWASRLLSSAELPLPLPMTFSFALDGARPGLRAPGFRWAPPSPSASCPRSRPPGPTSCPRCAARRARSRAGRRGFSLRDALVTAQLALSLVLLVAGSLLLRSLAEARRIPPGFDPDRLAVLSFNLKMNGYSEDQATEFQRRMTERLRGLPGVEQVALVTRPPLGHDINMEGIRIPGAARPGRRARHHRRHLGRARLLRGPRGARPRGPRPSPTRTTRTPPGWW